MRDGGCVLDVRRWQLPVCALHAHSRVTAARLLLAPAACKRRPALKTCTRKHARGGRIPFLHGACVCIWSLYANGAAPVGRCTGRVMGTRFAAHTPREHEHGVCSGRGSKMRLKTNLLLRVSSVLSHRVTVALRFAPAAIHEGVHPVQLALRM